MDRVTLLRVGRRKGLKLSLDLGRYGVHAHILSDLHTPMVPILTGLMELGG